MTVAPVDNAPPVEDTPWTDAQIAARANDPMPDVPVIEGLSPLVVTVEPETMALMAAAAPQPGTRAAMLHVADGLVGLHEQPMGSNHAPPITTEYGVDASWCDMSITYEGHHSGNAAAIGHFAYCPAHSRWFYNRHQWAYGAGDLQPGDVVFYSWGGHHTLDADHVGLVKAVHSDGTFDAYEGNHNDRFGIVRRDHRYVAGRGRPHYPNGTGEASAPTPPAPKPPSTGKPKFAGRYLRYAHGHDLMHGQDVTWTQRLLAHHGHAVKVDGWYGAVTAAAVRAFQQSAHLSVDGVVGPQTWAAL
jgi:Putative peptidoglycan binding domain/CHAP domain